MKIESTLRILFIVLFINNSLPVMADDSTIAVQSCNAALEQDKPQAALDIAERLIQQNPQSVNSYLCKGRALNALGKADAAEDSMMHAIKLAEPGLDQIIAHLLLGNLHKQYQHNDKALHYYQAGLTSAQSTQNQKFMRISHHLMAETYTLQGDYNAALSSYQSGSQLDNNDNERADSYERLAYTYHALKQLDKAIEYQLKAVMMQKRAGTLDQYAEANLALAKLFSENKDYPSAQKTLDRMLTFSQENGGRFYEAKTDLYLAELKLLEGDDTSARRLLDEAERIAGQLQAAELIQQVKKTRATLH